MRKPEWPKGKMLQEDKITNETKNKCYMCHVVIIRYKNQVRWLWKVTGTICCALHSIIIGIQD